MLLIQYNSYAFDSDYRFKLIRDSDRIFFIKLEASKQHLYFYNIIKESNKL